jgi:hypothetical protein
VNAYFCRVFAEKNQGRPTFRFTKRQKGYTQLFCNLEGTRRLWTKQEANLARKLDDRPRLGAGAPPTEPIRGELVDPASTTFEDE